MLEIEISKSLLRYSDPLCLLDALFLIAELLVYPVSVHELYSRVASVMTVNKNRRQNPFIVGNVDNVDSQQPNTKQASTWSLCKIS